MHYKYKILHVPTGNYVAVCYNNDFRMTKTKKITQWLREGNRDTELLCSTSGICGFFLSSDFSEEKDAPDLVFSNRKQGELLIQNYNFRFDVTMDLYTMGKRTELLEKIARDKNFSLALPNEFEIIRLESN